MNRRRRAQALEIKWKRFLLEYICQPHFHWIESIQLFPCRFLDFLCVFIWCCFYDRLSTQLWFYIYIPRLDNRRAGDVLSFVDRQNGEGSTAILFRAQILICRWETRTKNEQREREGGGGQGERKKYKSLMAPAVVMTFHLALCFWISPVAKKRILQSPTICSSRRRRRVLVRLFFVLSLFYLLVDSLISCPQF